MQFGGVIYFHDLSQPRVVSTGKDLNVMTPMKLSDPEIVPRVILAMVDGNGLNAKRRENQLKNAAWPMVKTQQFTNTKDSAWGIVDTILGIPPTGIKLSYIQNELVRICDLLPKHFPRRTRVFRFFAKLFGFLPRTPHDVSS